MSKVAPLPIENGTEEPPTTTAPSVLTGIWKPPSPKDKNDNPVESSTAWAKSTSNSQPEDTPTGGIDRAQSEDEEKSEDSEVSLVGRANIRGVAAAVAIEEREFQYTKKIVKNGEEFTEEVVYIETKRMAIYTSLYVEASTAIQSSVNNEGEDAVDATCAEHCTDFCCQSCVCHFKAAFSKQRSGRKVHSEEIMSPVLRRGRAKGWGMYKSIICPLVTDIERDTWVTAQLITAILAVLLSIVALGLKETRAVSILFFACALVCSILAVLDAAFTLRSCRSCRQCHAARKRRQKSKASSQGMTNKVEAKQLKGSEKNEAERSKSEEEESKPSPDQDSSTENTTNEKEKQKTSSTSKDSRNIENGPEETSNEASEIEEHACLSGCRTTSDVLRIILTELLIYVLMICGMFEAIVGQGKTPGNTINIFLLSITCISLLIYVYIARIIIIVRMIKNVQKIRRPDPEKQRQAGSKSRYDPTISKLGLSYQIYFFVHVVMQMLVQILILVAIAGKIEYDNRQLFDDSVLNDHVHASGHLWYMMVTGYILPVMGVFTFFISTFFWAQEFPVGLCLDLVSILEMESSTTTDDDTPGNKNSQSQEFVKVIDQFVKIDNLDKDFHDLRSTGFFKKFFYPFKTPMLIIVCMVYAILALAFVISAGVSLNEGSLMPQILNGGGWAIYYIIAIVLAVAANMYTMLVAAFWMAIIVAIIVAIAIIIILIIISCICGVLACFSDD